MAEEIITIFKVGTKEAITSIGDLRENVKLLKKTLETTQIDTEEGWKKYQDTLDELKVNQNALKDAMYATTGSLDDLTKAATGTTESYNSLVHRMAALKEELRATDVSTEAGKARFKELAGQINEVNDKLKEMDALQGNYQRNVGNYEGALKKWSSGLDSFGKALNVTKGGVNGLKMGMDGLSKSPAMATLGILVSVCVSLANTLKDNEQLAGSLQKTLDSLKPIMDFLSGVIETLATWLGEVLTNVGEFVSKNGIAEKVVKAVVGIGNAIVNFVIAPFKAVIAAIKVFKEQGIKGIKNAAKAFGGELKSGVSFKENFNAGQAIADTFIAGAKSRKKKVKQAGKDLTGTFLDGMFEKIDEEINKEIEAEIDKTLDAMDRADALAVARAKRTLDNLDKAYDHRLELNEILEKDDEKRAQKSYEITKEANEKKLSLLEQFAQDALERGDLEAYLNYQQEAADLEVEIETNAVREKERLRDKDTENAKKNAEAQKKLLQGVADATSGILGSIADLYEADEENAEKNAEQIKSLRIASATIDTISGAIGAYMSAVKSMPTPWGAILGAAQAAAVTAAGIAQIAKIRNTKVGKSSGNSSSVPAITPAPAVGTSVPNVRSVTSASEEDRLNRMAQDQRVYILSSDIEASQNQRKTQVAESSF